jgi:hypothetical protein
MAVLFISHSSKDDALATALEAWLRVNGLAALIGNASISTTHTALVAR